MSKKPGLHLSNNKLYRVWGDMKSRCNNPNDTCYKNYGGRGIKVCDEWSKSSESFGKWALSNGYEEGLTIDRIDNNGNYSPSNCKWSTYEQQSRNKRNNFLMTIDGITKICGDWAQEWNLKPSTLRYRYLKGERGDRLKRNANIQNNHTMETRAKLSEMAKIRFSKPSNNNAYKNIPIEQFKSSYIELGTIKGVCELYGICRATFSNKIKEFKLEEWYKNV